MPLVAHCAINLFGQVAISGLGSSALGPLQYTGPDLVIADKSASGALPTGPPLIGSGKSYRTVGSSLVINLRQTRIAELDGLKAITVEGAFELSQESATLTLIGSAGGISNSGDALAKKNTVDLVLKVQGGILEAKLRVNGVLHTLDYHPVAPRARHYVALSYDGTSISLYYDGRRVAQQAAAGPITQNVTDDVTIGTMNSTGPEGQAYLDSTPGCLIDGLRVSSIARYQGDAMIAPSKEFVPDEQTIALMNFDDDPPGFVRVEYGPVPDYPSPAYVVIERSKDEHGNWTPFIAGANVHDLWFRGGLWCWWCAYLSHFDNLVFHYSYMGLVLAGNSNQDQVNNLAVMRGGPIMRYGLLMAVANGNRVNGAAIGQAVFPLIVEGGARMWLSDLLITPDPKFTQYGALFSAAAPSIRGIYFDEEEGAPPGFAGSLIETGNWAPSDVSGIEVDGLNTGHDIVLDDGYGASITGGSLNNSKNGPPIYINGSAPLKSPVVVSAVVTDAAQLTNRPQDVIATGVAVNRPAAP